MNKIISRSRLLPILDEFGSYPGKYRQTIWKNILKLPQNSHQRGSNKAFTALLKKGYHPCVASYDTQFPLFDQRAVRQLKKICSCMAHWSNLFGHLSFVPGFVFPFLKQWRFDSVSCFETLATIMLNQGQLWFEFAPLEPYNYLGMVENVLGHFDPVLMAFYQAQKISVHTYGWTLLQTAFSEVFDERDWLQVWDHVLTHESHFPMFLVCAFSIVQREKLLRCTTVAAIESTFHEQAVINVGMMLRKCREMMKSCPSDIHPAQYLQPFQALRIDSGTAGSGHYQSFNYFPKMLFDAKANELRRLKDEEQNMQRQFLHLESIDKSMVKQVERQVKANVHEQRLRGKDRFLV